MHAAVPQRMIAIRIIRTCIVIPLCVRAIRALVAGSRSRRTCLQVRACIGTSIHTDCTHAPCIPRVPMHSVALLRNLRRSFPPHRSCRCAVAGIPNSAFPSDHLSMHASFAFAQRPTSCDCARALRAALRAPACALPTCCTLLRRAACSVHVAHTCRIKGTSWVGIPNRMPALSDRATR